MGDEGCNICSQNSEFFQNSDMKGYIANIPFLGNVFVLTQAKMYLQYSEFLQKYVGVGEDYLSALMQKSRTHTKFHKQSKNVRVWGFYYKTHRY